MEAQHISTLLSVLVFTAVIINVIAADISGLFTHIKNVTSDLTAPVRASRSTVLLLLRLTLQGRLYRADQRLKYHVRKYTTPLLTFGLSIHIAFQYGTPELVYINNA